MDRTYFWKASLLMVALAAVACGQEIAPEPPSAKALAVREEALFSQNKILILADTVTGGLNSREAQAAAVYNYPVDVVTGAQWSTMTAADFAQYRLLVLGDASCASLNAVSAAVANRFVWGPTVNGNVFIAGTAPVHNGAHSVTQQAIRFASAESGKTGLYVSLSCYYQGAQPGTQVTLLEPFGLFTVRDGGCHPQAHVVGWHTELEMLSDDMMSDWSCSVGTTFDTFPAANFSPWSIAVYSDNEVSAQGGQEFVDGWFGAPYILTRGSWLYGCGDGETQVNEECDFGFEANGQPGVMCSATCRLHWCGDGVVDPGESCDFMAEGQASCPRTCRTGPSSPPRHPPVARCKNLELYTPADTCGVSGSIDDGSSDPDGDLVECTQAITAFNAGSHTVSLVCRDSEGQTGSCTATVNVWDNVPPSLSCPAASPVECGSSVAPSASPNAAKDNCGAVELSHKQEGDSRNLGSVISTQWTAKDGSGNTASCVSQAQVVDTLAPSIALNGNSYQLLECAVDAYSEQGVRVADQCTADLSGRLVITGAVNTAKTGNYPLTYKVTDEAGLSATASRSVDVADRLAPVLSLKGSSAVALECGVEQYVEAGATAMDLCAGELAVSIQNPGVSTAAKGSYAIGYKAVDPKGNAATATRTVSVKDSLPPSISLVGSAAMKLECGVDSFTNPGATAMDACSGPLTNIATSGAVNTAKVGNYAVSYSVVDGAGLSASVVRAVQVADTKAPSLTLQGANPLNLECGVDTYAEAGAAASDVCAGPLAVSIENPGVNPAVKGTYAVAYKAVDPSGNALSTTRTVNVKDTRAPSITLVGSASMSVPKGGTFVDPGAKAADACTTSLSIVKTGSVNTAVPGTYTLSYSVTDGAGLSASVSRTVKVEQAQSCPAVSVKPTQEIWPPNHKMWSFNLSECAAVANPCGAPVDINAVGTITSIYSDEVEDADGNGDGKTTGDIVITGQSSFELRAERQGKGNGRVYGVNFTVADGNGGVQAATCKFVVPHDQSGRGGIDDGAAAGYTVSASF